MRNALSKPKRGGVASIKTIAPPIGGWNARDNLATMKATDAIRLDNWLPSETGVKTRASADVHASGLGGFVETLIPYEAPAGLTRLFAATPDTIFDASVIGPVGAGAVTGLGNGRWQYATFAALGGFYLTLCNGQDTVRQFDGASWTVPAITGVDTTTLANVAVHMSRLWFVQENTLDAWYLPAGSIQGAATRFPIGPLCTRGGSLLAVGSWTRDGGAGLDDLVVFVTTMGEVVVFSGTDPAAASTFQRVGTFLIPKPIGPRCLVKMGADLVILTMHGALPLSSTLDKTRSALGRVSFTDKIGPAFRAAYTAAGGSHGWEVVEYPAGEFVLVNVPLRERSTQHQYVMNTRTGAWCRFTGFNAGCWTLWGDQLFFGDNAGNVYRYGAESATPTVAIMQSAYSTFGTPLNKRFTLARPRFIAPPGYAPQLMIQTDYDTREPPIAAVTLVDDSAQWDVAAWDETYWAADSVPILPWQTVEGAGFSASLALAIATREIVTLNGLDLAFEPGGPL